nr:uncharacterized protein LOC127487306 [Oryctolagus cuniculus]
MCCLRGREMDEQAMLPLVTLLWTILAHRTIAWQTVKIASLQGRSSTFYFSVQSPSALQQDPPTHPKKKNCWEELIARPQLQSFRPGEGTWTRRLSPEGVASKITQCPSPQGRQQEKLLSLQECWDCLCVEEFKSAVIQQISRHSRLPLLAGGRRNLRSRQLGKKNVTAELRHGEPLYPVTLLGRENHWTKHHVTPTNCRIQSRPLDTPTAARCFCQASPQAGSRHRLLPEREAAVEKMHTPDVISRSSVCCTPLPCTTLQAEPLTAQLPRSSDGPQQLPLCGLHIQLPTLIAARLFFLLNWT